MRNEYQYQETTIRSETIPDQEALGGLTIRTDLRAGISIEEIQGQVSSWWDNLYSSLSLLGNDASQVE